MVFQSEKFKNLTSPFVFFFVQSELPQENSGICHSVGKRNEETPVDENFSTISDLWRKTEKEKL